MPSLHSSNVCIPKDLFEIEARCELLGRPIFLDHTASTEDYPTSFDQNTSTKYKMQLVLGCFDSFEPSYPTDCKGFHMAVGQNPGIYTRERPMLSF